MITTQNENNDIYGNAITRYTIYEVNITLPLVTITIGGWGDSPKPIYTKQLTIFCETWNEDIANELEDIVSSHPEWLGNETPIGSVWNPLASAWVVFPVVSQEEIASKSDTAIRQQRNALLFSSDWTQLPDVPLATKEAWAIYRQALRDITDQPGYPLDITWPVAPA